MISSSGVPRRDFLTGRWPKKRVDTEGKDGVESDDSSEKDSE